MPLNIGNNPLLKHFLCFEIIMILMIVISPKFDFVEVPTPTKLTLPPDCAPAAA